MIHLLFLDPFPFCLRLTRQPRLLLFLLPHMSTHPLPHTHIHPTDTHKRKNIMEEITQWHSCLEEFSHSLHSQQSWLVPDFPGVAWSILSRAGSLETPQEWLVCQRKLGPRMVSQTRAYLRNHVCWRCHPSAQPGHCSMLLTTEVVLRGQS